MGKHLSLTASDGHTLGAYRADPSGTPKGALVVIQEIFGVNSHIRNVCDRIAAQGYVAIAPAIFDRIERDFQSGYSADEVAHARTFIGKIDWNTILLDVQAAVDDVKSVGPVGIIGFCLGGSVAFLAATRLDGLAASAAFYGGAIVKFADEKPKCPVQMHFGEQDTGIPMSDVEIIKQKRPDTEIFVYPAGHGFCCDERSAFNEESAKLAWQRTYEFFAKTITS